MKQLKSIQVPKQYNMLDRFSSEKSIYSDRNFFLNQYRTINRLLKLNYSYYYKINFNIYHFIKKLITLNIWRFYLKPLHNIHTVLPYFKFFPQIQLKDYMFYNQLLAEKKFKSLLLLNNRFFCTTPYLKLFSKNFKKNLSGGLNSIFLCNINTSKNIGETIQSFNTTVFEKKIITKANIYSSIILNQTLTIIFYIALSNYILLYKQFLWNILFRL